MDWLQSNWIWIVLVGTMIAMHLFGHGGHGHSHGGGTSPGRDAPPANDTEVAPVGDNANADGTVPKVANSTDPAPRGAPAHAGQPAPEIPKVGTRHKHG